MRENISWSLGIGLLNLLLQTSALMIALLSLLFGRDAFSASALIVAVLEPAGLAMILVSAMLARRSPELERIRKHVTQMETPPQSGSAG